VSDGASRIFCGTELAARIERAECRMLEAGAAAARRRDPAAGAVILPIAGGRATWAFAGSPLNKVSGLGFAGVPAEAELEAVERAFAARGEVVRVELANLGDPEVGAVLTRRGYALSGFENVLGLKLSAAAARPFAPDLEVAESGAAERGLWLDVVVTGFAHPDSQGVPSDEEFPREVLERTVGDLATSEGFRCYLARRAGVPAGGASLRLDEGVAQLAGAATLPAHRRRGVQSALLAARLAAAAAAGCEVAVVTTLPGSKSQQNVQRQGFELLYTRAVLVLPT
jgi:ribosomal protein S18 acetylase RimI-like enzyme